MNESSIAILVVRVRGWETANRNWVENCKSATAIDNKMLLSCCRQIWWIVSAATLLSKATVLPLRSKLGVE